MHRRSLNALRNGSSSLVYRALKFRSDALLATVPGFLSLSLSPSPSLSFSLFLSLSPAVSHVHIYNVFEQLRRIFGVAIVAGVGGPRGGIIRGERVRASSRANE